MVLGSVNKAKLSSENPISSKAIPYDLTKARKTMTKTGNNANKYNQYTYGFARFLNDLLFIGGNLH